MEASQILEYLPQQKPFRFLDEIIEIDENRIVGTYEFKKMSFFMKVTFQEIRSLQESYLLKLWRKLAL